jgi:SpoVK/Ycf46/Vps4 family AAA+-type ATPase
MPDSESDALSDSDWEKFSDSENSEESDAGSPSTPPFIRSTRSTDNNPIYNLRPRMIVPNKKFGTFVYNVINQHIRDQVKVHERDKKRSAMKRKFEPSNELLPPPPFALNNWESLVKLARMSKETPFKDCQDLPVLLPAIEELNQMIGLTKIKDGLADQIMVYCQRKKWKKKKTKMNHMVLMGPPGCGKTTLAHCIAKLFNLMGKIKSDKVTVGTRQNMIGSYVGHTAKNTQSVIDSALGGVLLIDEAYALGDGRTSDSTDSFSKACIDTLNQNLTEKANEFICIIIGYKDQLKRDFFSVNPGLERRFAWWYEIEKYDAKELMKIFHLMKEPCGLECDEDLTDFFTKHYKEFKNHAASIQDLIEKVDLVFTRSLFGCSVTGKVTKKHMEDALLLMNVIKETDDTPPPHMYT